ncbi:MAG: phosphopeptide-binding protein [Flavobacteriales bacterium]|nr:hypothetical protein [Flavobacteriales bacterium]MCB9167053.1 phosphopeptide-binding protein [Flavobacteriales bacterium]
MDIRPTLIGLSALLTACGNPGPTGNQDETRTDTVLARGSTPSTGPVVAPPDARVQVVEAPPAQAYHQTSLAVDVAPLSNQNEARFDFSVSGFELKQQTPDAPERGCANSPDGQHIHFILNNEPYLAKYEPSFTEKVEPGHNVLLAFLSRSYHESVKDPSAFVVKEFDMPGNSDVRGNIDRYANLFYSRPKGDYKKSDGERVLLDFYLVNAALSPEGLRVRATIDGQSFLLTKWAPYFIEGLELGEHTVRLELVDRDGHVVPGPFNDSGPRTFHLTEG